MAHDVFISHSTKDKGIADALCAALEATQIRCWVAPRDIPPAAEWATSIVEALGASRVMVIIVSKHSNDSGHVHRELTVAAEAGAVIVPVKIDDTPLEGLMEYYLADKHWLDAMNPPTKAQVAQLVDTVRAILAAEHRGVGIPVAEQQVRRHLTRRMKVVVATATSLVVVAGGTGVWIALRQTPDTNANSEQVDVSEAAGGTAEEQPADSTSQPVPENLRTYADVVNAYPANAPVVDFEAGITKCYVFDDGTSLVSFAGEYKGVRIRGGFYLTQEHRYDGSPGVLWESYGDTYFPEPVGDEWGGDQPDVQALAMKDDVFATLYEDTYDSMMGPRLTSYIEHSFGELEVGSGDLLTFDSSLRLVKVSEW